MPGPEAAGLGPAIRDRLDHRLPAVFGRQDRPAVHDGLFESGHRQPLPDQCPRRALHAVDDQPGAPETCFRSGAEMDRRGVRGLPQAPDLQRRGVAQRGPVTFAVPDRRAQPSAPVDGPRIAIDAVMEAHQLPGAERVVHEVRRYHLERLRPRHDARSGDQAVAQFPVHVAPRCPDRAHRASRWRSRCGQRGWLWTSTRSCGRRAMGPTRSMDGRRRIRPRNSPTSVH